VLYCYIDEDGNENPTLRVNPGDLLILKLKNELPVSSTSVNFAVGSGISPCAPHAMSGATNLHFHGLMIPPVCHQDDVIGTAIPAGAPSFEYRIHIPRRQPPGLYWYHPHLHGHTEEQVLGGASGALIVEGIERFNSLVRGLPERILIIRDHVRQTGSDPRPRQPAKDLSVNFVPVPYPNYPPAVMKTTPSQRELWRVVNASADTFIELHLLTNGKWQSMGLVAVDGVLLNHEDKKTQVEWTYEILLSSGGRAEFLFDAPAEGGRTQLLAAGIHTTPFSDEDDPAVAAASVHRNPVPDDDYTPPRWLITIQATADAIEPQRLPKSSFQAGTSRLSPLIAAQPTRTRKLYFSEEVTDPKDPRASTLFLLTEEGHRPAPFDPTAAPNITVHEGDVEDWIIENRSQEAHSFHIHQTHFIVLSRDGETVHEHYLRDTIELPYWDGVSPYPKIKVRIDFRSPAIIGTFPYHCHILQHEDGGMMGMIRVLKRKAGN
jgi:FtsP/CotA-like multicopper oxidase with cupredoxin domain